MKVYIVESICDFEYGCREVEAVFASAESAEAYIEEQGGNDNVTFWTDEVKPYYTIEVWEVPEEKEN